MDWTCCPVEPDVRTCCAPITPKARAAQLWAILCVGRGIQVGEVSEGVSKGTHVCLLRCHASVLCL